MFMGGDEETINTLYWMWKTLVAAEIGVWVDMFLVTWNCGKRGRTAWIAPSCCTTWYLYTFSQQKLFQLFESWKEYENAMHKNWSLNNYEVPDWLTSELDAIVYLSPWDTGENRSKFDPSFLSSQAPKHSVSPKQQVFLPVK
jgi:hypothetical protein